jgi:hypothetical protein
VNKIFDAYGRTVQSNGQKQNVDDDRQSPRRRQIHWSALSIAVVIVIGVVTIYWQYYSYPRPFLVQTSFVYRRDSRIFAFFLTSSGAPLNIVSEALSAGTQLPPDCGGSLENRLVIPGGTLLPERQHVAFIPLDHDPADDEIKQGYFIFGYVKYASAARPNAIYTTQVCVRRILLDEASFPESSRPAPFIQCERCRNVD